MTASLTKSILEDLNIKKIDREEYFYKKKNINKRCEDDKFEIFIRTSEIEPTGTAVLIDMEVIYDEVEYFIGLIYLSNEDVYYGSMGVPGIDDIKREFIEDDSEKFDDITYSILNEVIPEDFWEIRSRES